MSKIFYFLFKKEPIIDIVCVTYRQSGPLKVFIQSILNQTNPNWRLNVIHDGADEEFVHLMQTYTHNDSRIRYSCTDKRYNDWGHTLRDQGLKKLKNDYVLVTNGDNYYVPIFIEECIKKIKDRWADVIIFDMIHSHETPGGRPQSSYTYFETEFSRLNIDMGAAIIKSSIASKVGFRDHSHDGDATYFEDVKKYQGRRLNIEKITKVLFVHN